MNRLLSYISRKFVFGIAVFGLTSCINDAGECPDVHDTEDMITFSFQMVSSNVGRSRALDAGGHDETVSEWPAFEDKIVEGDFAFYIFAKDASEDWKMIMSMTDLRNNQNANMTVNGVSGVWMITAAIPKLEFENTIGYEIKTGAGQQIPFRAAVIANAGGGNTAATERVNYASLIKPTFSEFIQESNNLLFNVGSIHNPNSGDSGVSGIYKGAIPMYGMNEFMVSGEELYYSNRQDPAWMGHIDLLRALAKIRVIDNIENKNPDTGLPRIEEASIFSASARAYVLPYRAETFKGVQIDMPRSYIVAGAEPYSLKLGYLNDPDVHFGYLPEQTITGETPFLRLKVTLDKDAEGNLIQKDYDVPLSGYNSVDFREKFGLYILRNHVYTLSVDGVATDTPLSMDIEVAEWTEAPFELDFSQSLVVPEDFKLSFSNQAGNVDNTTGLVLFKPWTTTADGVDTYSPITCRFGIQSPIGATWTAYLNTIEGDQDAFAFLDNDGNLQPHLSGTVNNKFTTFRVVTQNRDPEIISRAKLQIYVRFADNSMMEVDLTPENTPNFKNYTFVQNPL